MIRQNMPTRDDLTGNSRAAAVNAVTEETVDSLLSTSSGMQHHATIHLISLEPTPAVPTVDHALVEKIGMLRIIVNTTLLRCEIANIVRLDLLYH